MDYVFFMYVHIGSTKELKNLKIFICFKWFKTILVALFDEMAQKLGKKPNQLFMYLTQDSITICLNDFSK